MTSLTRLRRTRPVRTYAFFHPSRRSLARGNLLVAGSLIAAVRISDFPHSRATLLLTLPLLAAIAGTVDTIRCMQPRWNFYHGGVVLCVYMDLMAICLMLFFLISPYGA